MFCCLQPLAAQLSLPDIVLQGTVNGTQNKTYLEVPFDVPAGVHRISVDFSYSGKDQKTALDLGIADPERFRGYSGGNKSHFTIAESDATPSYLPGAILAGKWKLLISVPNIRANEQSHYRAEVRFNSAVEDRGFALGPLEAKTRWYRGDMHLHTAHSDGSCTSQSGNRVPCPVFLTVQSAAAQGLDFIAITDHNATSQYSVMRELQPYFDRLLLIPGREITTFWGHFNIFGVTQYIDYRATGRNGRSVDDILREVRAAGGIASVNHADAPGAEICMGCKWEPPVPVDMALFTGVEVINGGRRALASVDFWDHQIANGFPLAAIGGSDSHDGAAKLDEAGAVGYPTTVVEARELSVTGILDGIRRGRAFIDLTASRDKILDMEARDNTATHEEWVSMGGTLQLPKEHSISVRIHVANCPDSKVYFILDGHESASMPPIQSRSESEVLHFQWKSDGEQHWFRTEVRDMKGDLLLLSNPIYMNYSAR